ncbi:MAG: hypothetical protein R3A52_11055 [Polyangiales bacterium]
MSSRFSAPTAHSQRLAPGAVFAGEYRVERLLAQGGMGAVYVATQRSTGTAARASSSCTRGG